MGQERPLPGARPCTGCSATIKGPTECSRNSGWTLKVKRMLGKDAGGGVGAEAEPGPRKARGQRPGLLDTGLHTGASVHPLQPPHPGHPCLVSVSALQGSGMPLRCRCLPRCSSLSPHHSPDPGARQGWGLSGHCCGDLAHACPPRSLKESGGPGALQSCLGRRPSVLPVACAACSPESPNTPDRVALSQLAGRAQVPLHHSAGISCQQREEPFLLKALPGP